MMNFLESINWKVRIKNKEFWLTAIPATLLVLQSIAAVFGLSLDFGDLGNKLLTVVNSVFGLFAIVGIIVDPTTKGLIDSKLARTYEKPKED